MFLNRFIKEICLLPYLYESIEFQTFLKATGDVDKAMTFPKQTTDELLARFREVMPINEVSIYSELKKHQMANELKIKDYNNKVNEFVRDCREFIDHLKKFKKQIKMIVPIKEQEVMHYRDFVDFLIKYEELNVKKQTAEDPFKANLLSAGEGKSDFKQSLTETVRIVLVYFYSLKT